MRIIIKDKKGGKLQNFCDGKTIFICIIAFFSLFLQCKRIGLRFTQPQCAYFVLLDVSEYSVKDGLRFCDRLLELDAKARQYVEQTWYQQSEREIRQGVQIPGRTTKVKDKADGQVIPFK